MRKAILLHGLTYTYDGNRKGAKYTFDNGEHWKNGGEATEICLKGGLGFTPTKDGNTPFDVGSDIEPLQMSVKSSKATLTSIILGYDFDSILKCYFERTASNQWAWGILIDDTITAYIMNAQEFERFTREWASYDDNRKVIKYKATSGKMIKWLEEQLEEEGAQ